jgi:hypothetical protein
VRWQAVRIFLHELLQADLLCLLTLLDPLVLLLLIKLFLFPLILSSHGLHEFLLIYDFVPGHLNGVPVLIQMDGWASIIVIR